MNKSQDGTKVKTGIPEPALRRMPVYLFYLKRLREQGELNISAPQIGKDLDYDSTQVVKDLAYTGITGKPRVGYNNYELISALEEFLGFNRKNEAFLVGTGNLGSALLSYQGMQEFGVKIIAGFDNNKTKIGKQFGNIYVLDFNKFEDLAKRLHITIGILCTPAEVAQQVAEKMVASGIKAIWNLSPAYLKLPANIIVQNTSMYANLAVLVRKLYDQDIHSRSKISENPYENI